jgi:stringent starvation protein B
MVYLMHEVSTKPYLLRAIYEWCTDNGYTPHIAVVVDAKTSVPMQFVKNGEIVLNISFDATSGLKMENDNIHFSARFGGVSRDIYVPVANVIAIYARENGQGMAFEVTPATPSDAPVEEENTAPSLVAIKDLKADVQENATDSEDDLPEPPKKSKKPLLKLIK